MEQGVPSKNGYLFGLLTSFGYRKERNESHYLSVTIVRVGFDESIVKTLFG